MNYIAYFDKVLEPSYCKGLIKKFQSSPHLHTTVKNEIENYVEINLSKEDEEQVINSSIGVFAKYKTLFGIDDKVWPEKIAYEQLKLKRFFPQEHINFHTNVPNYLYAKRFLSFQIYLNDVLSHGETAFKYKEKVRDDYVIIPKVGRMLVFPSFWTHPYIEKKPKGSSKFIIVGHLHYA